MPARETDAAVAAASGALDTPQGSAAVVVRTTAASPAASSNIPAYQAADTVTVEPVEMQPTESIDEILSRLVFHDDRPIENLPEMQSSELKLIGRCVSLCVKQTINGVTAVYYYTGLVSMVTDTTVTLIYVNRYTTLDFKLYQLRERHMADPAYTATDALHTVQPQRRIADVVAATQNSGGSGDASANTATSTATQKAFEQDPNLFPVPGQEAAGSLAPAVRLSLHPANVVAGEASEATSSPTPTAAAAATAPSATARPRHLHTCAASIGVLPFVTFLRTNIHDVSFGRDPNSDFYSLFSDPARELMDVQFLRTFVRRYLVHTSQHNNPRQVPMYAFLTVRCGCRTLDPQRANSLAAEELPGLLKADRAIAKEKRKQRNREARLTAAVQDYQAPPGLFANTGVLYLTQIPQQTLTSASIILLFTVVFTLFLILSLTTSRDTLVTYFVVNMLGCFVPSIMVWAMTGMFTLFHATTMRLPLRQNLELLIARVIFSVASVVCSIASVSTVTQSLSNERVMQHLYRRRYDSLCAFYEHHQCSGFYYSCEQSPASFLCATCVIDYPERECFVDIWQRLQFVTMPLVMFSVFILLGSVNSLMVLLKLYLVARSISVTVFS